MFFSYSFTPSLLTSPLLLSLLLMLHTLLFCFYFLLLLLSSLQVCLFLFLSHFSSALFTYVTCLKSFLLFQACQLPLMEYLAERMCSLCYERAWYAKLGGCIAIKFLVERMAMRWVHEHLFLFLTALLFVMMDLTGEVGSPLYLSQGDSKSADQLSLLGL